MNYVRYHSQIGRHYGQNTVHIRLNGKGGRPIAKMSMHRILRNKIYIGQIENKKEGTFAKDEHEPIISNDLFNRVQSALANNSNNKSSSTPAPNILTGKLFNHNGEKFINQRTSGKNKKTVNYYAIKGFYLSTVRVDEIIIKTITDFLNSDMSKLPINLSTVLKQVNIVDMTYTQKRCLIRTLVEKVVYSQEQLIYTLTTDAQKLQQFATENYINQNAEPIEYVASNKSITITEKVFLRKYVNTVYDHGKNGVLSVMDNNHLVVKAFATAWKYRELYERDCGVDNIIHNLHTSPRQFYRYLDIAYMNPDKINQILSGKLKINVNDLFQIARENQL